jgi:hypothetical protein
MNVMQINQNRFTAMDRDRRKLSFGSPSGPRVRAGYVWLWALVLCAWSSGCAQEDDELERTDESVTGSTEQTDTDSSTDSTGDTDSDTGIPDTETALTWETYVYDGSCEQAQTEAECQQASDLLPVITNIEDYGHGCDYFSNFRTISRGTDGACTFGTESRGFCQYQRGAEVETQTVTVDGCGVFASWPGYIQMEDGLYFGSNNPDGLSYCQFTFDGFQMIASPPECECLCDGEQFTQP